MEYEISYEDYEDSCESEIYEDETEEREYEMVVTEYSKERVVYTLKILQEFTKLWRGKMIVSYDERELMRDYIIKIIVDEVEFYNGYIGGMFSELLEDEVYVTIRRCFENEDKVELIIIQSNAEEFDPNDEGYL